MPGAPPDLPLVRELRPAPDAAAAFEAVCRQPHCLFLDSALRDPQRGRYSFLAADPFEFLQVAADGSDALAVLDAKLEPWTAPTLPELPPFQGGAAGLFAYDLGRSLERLPAARFDEFAIPALAVGLYDMVLAFDHQQQRAWLISQGWPAAGGAERRRRAVQRSDQFLGWLERPPRAAPLARPGPPDVAADQLAPQFQVGGAAGLTSNFTADAYRRMIERAVEYIHAGDVFQVNLAQRLLVPRQGEAVELYRRLRQCNPAPFAGYFDGGDFQLLSASPERFLQLVGGHVEARPIKGTRQRTARPEADFYAAADLRQSEKDRAENIMIVDLLRNDLSRVCRPDSVQVTQLCELETYAYVQHLVSAVCGRLRDGQTALDLVRAAFPGGSITGAPKVRAMEIIADLEPTARGPYCGSLGYVGFDGSLDLSILIRTITAARGWWQFPVGGGIVAQSDPQREYEETWHKAQGIIQALR